MFHFSVGLLLDKMTVAWLNIRGDFIMFLSIVSSQNRYSMTQPEVQLRVGAFDVGVLVFSAAAIFL